MTTQHEKFQQLLLQYAQENDPEKRHEIEKNLWEEYGQERAVLVLDMSGFSLLTRKFGIVHYLSMVRRMQLTCEPIVKSYTGGLIKFEADNCFALFPTPILAVNAAIAMQHAFEGGNILTSDEFDIHVSCGIDYGKVLLIENEDCFGDAVNCASKLGEDIAGSNEILITQTAMTMIPSEAGIKSREMTISISGLSIPAFAIDYGSFKP
jgi:class 3 adenylate cyclase